jgi:NADH:ubiquinone oxidoreductase subunit 6 (subunit J)
MSKRALLGVMLACLVVGMGLMLVFESALSRVVGLLALFAFIVIGVFLIADPEFLASEEEDQVGSRRA